MAIGYTRETWVDGVQLVDAARLNNIETGVKAACDELDEFYDSSTKEMNTPGDVNIQTLSSNINIGTSSIWIGLDAYISFLRMRSQNSAEYTVGNVDSALANTLSLINYGGDIIIQNADNSDSVHGDIKLLTDGQAMYNGVEIATKAEIGASSTDLNTLTSEGMYQIQNPNNAPAGVTGWVTVSVVPTSNDSTYCRQMLYIPSSDDIYTRNNAGGTWGSWNKLALKSDLSNSSITPTVTNAVGTLKFGACYHVGNIYFLGFSVTNGSAVAVGSDAVSATVSGLPTAATLMPSTAIYAGSTCYVCTINGTTFKARVTGSAHVADYTAYGTLIFLAS